VSLELVRDFFVIYVGGQIFEKLRPNPKQMRCKECGRGVPHTGHRYQSPYVYRCFGINRRQAWSFLSAQHTLLGRKHGKFLFVDSYCWRKTKDERKRYGSILFNRH